MQSFGDIEASWIVVVNIGQGIQSDLLCDFGFSLYLPIGQGRQDVNAPSEYVPEEEKERKRK